MNPYIVSLMEDEGKMARLSKGLPLAFTIASIEAGPKNPAVGFLREQILVAFLIDELGVQTVKIPASGVNRGYDVRIGGEELSIKTVLKYGKIKVLWTSDTSSVRQEVQDYLPEADIFLVKIFWAKTLDSLFYIPQWVQQEVMAEMGGSEKYLHVAEDTNHRGINLSSKAKNRLLDHSYTLKSPVNWIEQDVDHSPYERWETFWQSYE